MSSKQPKIFVELSEVDETTGMRVSRTIKALRHVRSEPDIIVDLIESQHFRVNTSDGGINVTCLRPTQSGHRSMLIPDDLLDELIEQLLVFKTERLNNPVI
jgi:hypothetical protein